MQDNMNYNNFYKYFSKDNIESYSTYEEKKFIRFDNIDNFIDYMKNFKWTRKITQTHIHHTYIPSYKDFNGNNHQRMNNAMRNFHMIERDYREIAQNITVFPDGVVLIGRDFNDTPASIYNHNKGAFCIEQVGNFDKNNDTINDIQYEATLKISKCLIDLFNSEIVYHNEYSDKTCPGSNYPNKDKFIKDINLLNCKFTDIYNHWAKKDILEISNLGIMNGIGDNKFNPNGQVTRAELAVVSNRIIKYLENK